MAKKKNTHDDITGHLAEDGLYYFDEEAAQRPVNFVERYCRHIVGEHQGDLIQMMDWQKSIVKKFFGTLKKGDGLRRYRNLYIEVPKKNAKSTLLAALGLYLTCADGEKGAEIFCCAGDKFQARIIFDAAREMIECDPGLSRIFIVLKNEIKHKSSKSTFKVLSADAKTKHGPNVHAVIFDELHVQPNRELWDTLTKGVANRRQPVVVAITTAGYKGTFAHTMHIMCMNILQGRLISKFWLVYIYGSDETKALKNWDKEEIWKETNPGYGITVNKEYFESELENIQMNPANLSGFLRLHLNVWTGTEKSWEILQHWDNGNTPVNPEALKGRTAYMGVDLAPVNDTTAVFLVFPDDNGETFDTMCQIFIPESTLDERGKQENDNFEYWVEMGLVTVMPGNITDEDTIFEFIKQWCEIYHVAKIGCDTYNAYNLLARLQLEGLPAEAYPQTMKGFSPPMRHIEKMMTAGNIRHSGNPILAWQASNVVIMEDTKQNRMPNKAKSKSRIDAIAAMITAFGCWMAAVAAQENTYKASDIISFIGEDEDEKNS